MTDNRTSEPTEAQVEAAAKAMWDLRKLISDPEWDALEYGVKLEYRKDARAALVAAQGATPAQPSNGADEDVLVEVEAERDRALARIAEAAKLHRPFEGIHGEMVCAHRYCVDGAMDQHKWPCPTAVALGLNEGENE